MVKLNKYILIIDDSKQYQLLYKTYLNKILGENIDIKGVSSSKDGMDILLEGKIPDLILLDYILPDINGIDTLKKIRALDLFKDTPILFLTGYGDEHVAKESLKNGADDYLIKSEVNEASLSKSITSIFNNYLEKKRDFLLQKKIEKKAMFDHLTGVSNRFQFEEILSNLLKSGRKEDLRFALFLFDIDNFKNINDSYGHHAGDLVLKEFVNRVSQAIRTKDVLARLGGDEFALLVRNVEGVDDIIAVADKIFLNFQELFKIDSDEIKITISIGITRCPEDTNILKDLFSSADKALYHAKYKGKNQYQFFSDLEYSKFTDKLQLTKILIEDIDESNIAIEYDFIYKSNNMKEQEISGIIPCNIYSKRLQSKIDIKEVMSLAKKNNKATFVQKKLIELFLKDYANVLKDDLNFGVFCTVDYLMDANAIDYIKNLLINYEIPSGNLILIIDEDDIVEQIDRVDGLLAIKNKTDFKFYFNSFGEKYLALRPLFELNFYGVFLDTKIFKEFITNNQEQEILVNLIKGSNVDIIANNISSEYDMALMMHYGITSFSGEYFRTINGANEIKDYKI